MQAAILQLNFKLAFSMFRTCCKEAKFVTDPTLISTVEHHASDRAQETKLCPVALDREVGPLGATLEDGYRAAVINDAMVEAAASGRKVSVQYEA